MVHCSQTLHVVLLRGVLREPSVASHWNDRYFFNLPCFVWTSIPHLYHIYSHLIKMTPGPMLSTERKKVRGLGKVTLEYEMT